MKIYRPIQTNIRSQGFGEAVACAKVSNGIVEYPYKIANKRSGVCPYGYVDFYRYVLGMKGHNGWDDVCYRGEYVYFPILAETTWYSKDASDNSGGLGVDVFSEKRVYLPILPKHAGKEATKEWKENNGRVYVKFRFWHAQDTWADKEVKPGEIIMHGDSTGASSGDHVHWSGKICSKDGRTYDNGKYGSTNNGFNGAVDFSDYYTNEFILDVLGLKPPKSPARIAVAATKSAVTALLSGKVTAAQFKIIINALFLMFHRI